jgi:hypothetical protein
MTKTLTTILLATTLATATVARAQGTAAATAVPEGKTLTRTFVEVTALVVAVDLETREVTFKRTDGTIRTVVVSDEVRNLPQVAVGDTIKLQYQEAVSIRLDKSSGGTPSLQEGSGVSRNAPGSKPGAMVGRNVTISAAIDAIDAIDSVVTLKGPRGGLLDVIVEDRAILGKLNVGDLVVITYTQAVALSVEEVPAP